MPRAYGTTNASPYASAPAVGVSGDEYWNTTEKALYLSDGSAWVKLGATGPQGPTGPQGAPGLTVGSLDYRFSSVTSASPPNGDVRFNAGYPYSAVTTIWIARIDNNGSDQRTIFLLRQAGERIRIEDRNNANVFATFTLTAVPVDSGTYMTLAVAWYADSGGALTNNALASVFLGSRATPGLPPGGATGTVLTKASATDYDTVWQAPSGGGGGIAPAVYWGCRG